MIRPRRDHQHLHGAALAAALLAPGGAAWANCPPPYSTMFACEIPERDARVEVCQILTDEEATARGKKQFTYNYTVGTGPAELYFEDDGYGFSTKYMDQDTDMSRTTVGVGLQHGPYVYAFYVTGEYLGRPTGAQVHVFESAADFTSDERENEMQRRYCDPGTIRVNWENIAP